MCACVMAIKLDEIQERAGDQKPVYQLEWPNYCNYCTAQLCSCIGRAYTVALYS